MGKSRFSIYKYVRRIECITSSLRASTSSQRMPPPHTSVSPCAQHPSDEIEVLTELFIGKGVKWVSGRSPQGLAG